MFVRLLSLAVFAFGLAAQHAAAAESDRGFLWEATSASATVFLLGTIHVGARDLYPLPAAVEAAYRKSASLAVEADMTSQEAMLATAGLAMYEPPDNLERNISPSLYKDVVATLAGFGLPPELARAMKPAMLSMTLMVFEVSRIGLDPNLGIDLHLTRRARQDGKKVIELESATQQLEMLGNLPPEAQTGMLESAVEGIRDKSMARDMQDILSAWKRGDTDQLHRIAYHELERMPAAAAAPLRRALFDDRNATMAEKIAAWLGGRDSVLVAVGAGHMTGPTGIVERLRARGFKIQRR